MVDIFVYLAYFIKTIYISYIIYKLINNNHIVMTFIMIDTGRRRREPANI